MVVNLIKFPSIDGLHLKSWRPCWRYNTIEYFISFIVGSSRRGWLTLSGASRKIDCKPRIVETLHLHCHLCIVFFPNLQVANLKLTKCFGHRWLTFTLLITAQIAYHCTLKITYRHCGRTLGLTLQFCTKTV